MRSLLFAIACLAPCLPLQAENWPGWRGPARTGVSTESDVPCEWSAENGPRWRVDLPGAGISNPIVWDDRVFVTSSDGPRGDELHVVCLHRDDGRELWHLQLWGTAPTLSHGAKSSMASPTPVTDGRHVYAFFGTGDVFCLDFSGRLVWQRSLAAEYGEFENRFAASSSPLLLDDLLLLQCDHYGGSYALAIDKTTGENRWKTDRPDAWLSWSSPQLAAVEGTNRWELLLCGSERLDALDPLTGEKLWTLGGLAHECIPTPVLGHGLIYAVSGPNGETFALRPGGRGDVSQTHVAWRSPRGAPFVPSGILVGDYYYLVTDNGFGTCLDAHTGEELWRERFGGAYTASPVAAGGRIYFTNEDGETLVIAAHTPDFEELARNVVGEPVYASAAISQGRFFLRTSGGLFCFGN